MGEMALAPAKRMGGAIMTTMCCALHLVEEECRQQCCRPTGGIEDKDGAIQRTPSRAKGHAAASMEKRMTTEKDEVIVTPQGLCCIHCHNTNYNKMRQGCKVWASSLMPLVVEEERRRIAKMFQGVEGGGGGGGGE